MKKTAYTDLIEWFFAESGFELLDDCSDENTVEFWEPLYLWKF
jgi:hypothetical protein